MPPPILSRATQKKLGLPPGAVVFVGEARDAPVRLTVMDYDAHTLTETTPATPDEAAPLRDTATTTWIHADGVHDTDLVQALGDRFGVDALALEDLVNTSQRPKVEFFDALVLVVVKELRLTEAGALARGQIGLVVTPHVLLSFQETPHDLFGPVRARLRAGRGRIRRRGPDYLAYALLDVVVDHYLATCATLSERVEALEDRLLSDDAAPPDDLQTSINTLRRTLIGMRKAVWPARDLLGTLERAEHPRLSEAVQPFWRDAHDHAVQAADTVDSLRDVVASVHDLYLAMLSHRMNEVMKVLTIMGSIFIPLTFIAGVYGMNFSYMPELQAEYGYFVALGAMAALGVALAAYFRRRGWL